MHRLQSCGNAMLIFSAIGRFSTPFCSCLHDKKKDSTDLLWEARLPGGQFLSDQTPRRAYVLIVVLKLKSKRSKETQREGMRLNCGQNRRLILWWGRISAVLCWTWQCQGPPTLASRWTTRPHTTANIVVIIALIVIIIKTLLFLLLLLLTIIFIIMYLFCIYCDCYPDPHPTGMQRHGVVLQGCRGSSAP